MFATSLPVALDNGAGVPGLAVSMIFTALGVGGIKSTISPFIGDQYRENHKEGRVIRLKNGKLAIADGSRTIQFIYNAFYWYFSTPLCLIVADKSGSRTSPPCPLYQQHF